MCWGIKGFGVVGFIFIINIGILFEFFCYRLDIYEEFYVLWLYRVILMEAEGN